MQLHPLSIEGRPARTDEQLFANVEAAMRRGLPEVERHEPVERSIVIAASGPSLADELPRLRDLLACGAKLMAIRGAHDYLIHEGIIPDYALTVDPLPDSWQCFRR